MFLHLFKNRLKILLRDRELMFWTLIFPFILGTLFFMAFSKLGTSNQYQDIHIAIIDNENYQQDTYLKTTLEAVSQGADKLFSVESLEETQAKEKLAKKEITGYMIDGKLVVNQEGIKETIVKTFLDQYQQRKSTIETIINMNQGQISPELIASLTKDTNYITSTTYGRESPDSTVNYFYTLIAMTCLYGGFWGVKEIRDIQANQSSRAVRINLAPVHKLKTILYNLSATFCINIVSILLLLAYLTLGLKIDFGTQFLLVLLVCLIGCMNGIAIGMCIGTVCKKGEGTKTGILLTTTMTGAFLSGMMYHEMKYIINTNIPIVGYLNPSNLITDSLYALYYYDTYTKFLLNMSILGGITLLLLGISYYTIRRQKYESL